ncbi:MAG: asparagine synthase-related protein [Thermoanaerobaculia bacterium]
MTAYRWTWEPVPLAFDGRCVVALQGDLFVEGGTQGAPWLLERYRRSGPEALRGLDGEFAGLVWDVASGALLLFRDAFATRPIFFARDGGRVGVGTEIRQAARAAGIPLKADPRLAELEANGLPTEGRKTFWLGVSRVLPSEALRIDGGGSTSSAVWSLPAFVQRRCEAAEVARVLPDTLGRAVLRRSGTRQILLLSGGLDSTSIAAAAPGRFEGALTLSYPGYECDDAERARSVARFVGLRHDVLDITAWGPVRSLADTMRDCDQLPGMTAYQVRPAMERVRSLGAEVAVLGLGGDDFFLPPAVALADVLSREGPKAALCAVADLVRDGATGRVHARAFARHALRSVLVPWLKHMLVPVTESSRRPPLLWDSGARAHVAGWRNVSNGWWAIFTVLARAWSGSARETLEQLAAREGVGLAFPFFDRAIAELATSAWADAVMGRRRRKELLAQAFRGRLPALITDGWRGLLPPEPALEEVQRSAARQGAAAQPGIAPAVRAWRRIRLEARLAGQKE